MRPCQGRSRGFKSRFPLHFMKSLKNGNFCSSSRKAKISTTGIYGIFRGLKFEPGAEIGQKVPFYKGLKLGIDNESVVHISELGIEIPKIYKAKKFACKALKGRGVMSGIRIIYAYYENEDVIEFIEIYFKGDKANEDKKRIMKYYSHLKKST